MLWSPRVVPVEHNGALIRINDASGTLFDETFMKYQVSEQTRLRQVSAEIFVTEGLDAALNIDRESFNVAHPHYQYLATWMHNAFRQFATRHKDLAKEARTKRIARDHVQTTKDLARIIAEVVDKWSGGDDEPVQVDFVSSAASQAKTSHKRALVFSLEKIFEHYPLGSRVTAKNAVEFENDQAKLRGLVQVLYAAGLLDELTPEKREGLIADLTSIIFYRRPQ